MNPHFTFAAVLACGLYGILHQLPLTIPALDTTSPSALEGLERLPKSLQEATLKMARKGSLAREVLGDKFVDHFTATRQNECDLYALAVTDWEIKRYTEMC